MNTTALMASYFISLAYAGYRMYNAGVNHGITICADVLVDAKIVASKKALHDAVEKYFNSLPSPEE